MFEVNQILMIAEFVDLRIEWFQKNNLLDSICPNTSLISVSSAMAEFEVSFEETLKGKRFFSNHNYKIT